MLINRDRFEVRFLTVDGRDAVSVEQYRDWNAAMVLANDIRKCGRYSGVKINPNSVRVAYATA